MHCCAALRMLRFLPEIVLFANCQRAVLPVAQCAEALRAALTHGTCCEHVAMDSVRASACADFAMFQTCLL